MELRKVHIYFELFSLEWQEHLMDAVEKNCTPYPQRGMQVDSVVSRSAANRHL